MKQMYALIDLRNYEQVEWFCGEGLRMAKWTCDSHVYDGTTGKPIGIFFIPHGLHRRKAVKKANSFLKDNFFGNEIQRNEA